MPCSSRCEKSARYTCLDAPPRPVLTASLAHLILRTSPFFLCFRPRTGGRTPIRARISISTTDAWPTCSLAGTENGGTCFVGRAGSSSALPEAVHRLSAGSRRGSEPDQESCRRFLGAAPGGDAVPCKTVPAAAGVTRPVDRQRRSPTPAAGTLLAESVPVLIAGAGHRAGGDRALPGAGHRVRSLP